MGRAKKWQEEKKNLAQIEKENEELRAYLDYVESDSFLEKEARFKEKAEVREDRAGISRVIHYRQNVNE